MLAGHPDLGHRVTPGWIEGWFESVMQATSCLKIFSIEFLRITELTLEHVEADSAELVDIRVVDLGEEADLGRRHGVIVGEEELELEYTTCLLVSTDLSPSKSRMPS